MTAAVVELGRFRSKKRDAKKVVERR